MAEIMKTHMRVNSKRIRDALNGPEQKTGVGVCTTGCPMVNGAPVLRQVASGDHPTQEQDFPTGIVSQGHGLASITFQTPISHFGIPWNLGAFNPSESLLTPVGSVPPTTISLRVPRHRAEGHMSRSTVVYKLSRTSLAQVYETSVLQWPQHTYARPGPHALLCPEKEKVTG
ncbi:hypothetical protein J6590_024923 [Homalodisca vitripennis]|nr:hypothetical protein J6590_024923 [Homalodisca vitripennis]